MDKWLTDLIQNDNSYNGLEYFVKSIDALNNTGKKF